MANPKIKVKRSSVEGKVPAVSQLERGELAVNSYDGKVYILKDQFSVGIATTTHTINPWNEPGGVGAGISYSGDVRFVGSSADILFDKSDNALEFDDDVELKMGDSGDLLIFHKSSNGNSIIREQGGGVLSLQTNGAYMNVYDSTNQQTMAQFTNGGACQFRHNGTIRLQTTSSGAEVIGTLNVTGVSTSLTHHSTGGTYRGTQDTKTDVGFVMDLDKKLYVDYNGYLRNIIGHESADNSIQIGQHNTGLIDDIVLKPGTSGQVILHHGSNSSNIKLSTLTTVVNVNGTTVTDGLTVGNYDFPTTVGSEGLVLKVASDGNLEFGSGASGGVVPTEKTFTATQGQTVFTDTSTLPTYIQVFVNGIKIRPTTDFSKSGSSVTLVTGATAGDEIDLVRFD